MPHPPFRHFCSSPYRKTLLCLCEGEYFMYSSSFFCWTNSVFEACNSPLESPARCTFSLSFRTSCLQKWSGCFGRNFCFLVAFATWAFFVTQKCPYTVFFHQNMQVVTQICDDTAIFISAVIVLTFLGLFLSYFENSSIMRFVYLFYLPAYGCSVFI